MSQPWGLVGGGGGKSVRSEFDFNLYFLPKAGRVYHKPRAAGSRFKPRVCRCSCSPRAHVLFLLTHATGSAHLCYPLVGSHLRSDNAALLRAPSMRALRIARVCVCCEAQAMQQDDAYVQVPLFARNAISWPAPRDPTRSFSRMAARGSARPKKRASGFMK